LEALAEALVATLGKPLLLAAQTSEKAKPMLMQMPIHFALTNRLTARLPKCPSRHKPVASLPQRFLATARLRGTSLLQNSCFFSSKPKG
jgi:hypothetical protein